MFSKLQLNIPTYRIEALLPDYIVRGGLRPLGNFLAYLNDPARSVFALQDVDLLAFRSDRQMRGVKRESMTISKPLLSFISFLDAEQASGVQLLQANRPVIIYAGSFAIQGRVHVNVDAKESDLLDDNWDFFAVSQAKVFPVRTVAVAPTREVPLLFINRPVVQAYHIHEG